MRALSIPIRVTFAPWVKPLMGACRLALESGLPIDGVRLADWVADFVARRGVRYEVDR